MAVMMHLRFPHALGNIEDLLHENGIDASHEAVLVQQITHAVRRRAQQVNAVPVCCFSGRHKRDVPFRIPHASDHGILAAL